MLLALSLFCGCGAKRHWPAGGSASAEDLRTLLGSKPMVQGCWLLQQLLGPRCLPPHFRARKMCAVDGLSRQVWAEPFSNKFKFKGLQSCRIM